MTTFNKTWITVSGFPAAYTDTDNTNHGLGIVWSLKEVLKDNSSFPDGYWTVAGSGSTTYGSGDMDGVDRWTTYSYISATNNWICLKSQNTLGPLYLTIIRTGTSGSFKYILSNTLPTGGGTTTPPTQDGYYIDTGNVSWAFPGGPRPFKITVSMTSEGGFYMFETDGIVNVPITMFGVLQVDAKLDGDPLSCCILYKAKGAGANITISDTANSIYMWHSDNTTVVGSPMIPYFYNTDIFSDANIYYSYFSNTSTSFDNFDFPCFIYINQSSKQAIRGIIVDIYCSPNAIENKTMEFTTNANYRYIKFGPFWLPCSTSIAL